MQSSSQGKKFSIAKNIRSFRYAFNGIYLFFRQEHNAWIHLLATILAISLAFIFKCTNTEFIFIILAAGLVWAAELFNTAIEKFADFITSETKPEIKFIKDVSAAAVLLVAVAALITGCIIFIPKILHYV